MPDCNECHEPFDTWEALALHIMSHKDHRKGRIWASKVLVQVDNIHEHKERLPEIEHTAYGASCNRAFLRAGLTFQKWPVPVCAAAPPE